MVNRPPAVFIGIVFSLGCILISLASLLYPRFLYQEGIKQLKLKQYKASVFYLAKAEDKMPGLIPNWFVQADWYRIYTHHGQALYHLGRKGLKAEELKKARDYLHRAKTISPGSYRNMYWLARNEERLERLFAWKYPKDENPYQADILYQKTIALRPSGGSITYAYIKYLNYKKRPGKIPEMVEKLMEISPFHYSNLKKALFWEPALMESVESGLEKAEKNYFLRPIALRTLAQFYEEDSKYKKAIPVYKRYMEHPERYPFKSQIHLATLYLKAHDHENSFDPFARALFLSEQFESDLKRIYGIFRQYSNYESFLDFLAYLKKKIKINMILSLQKPNA